MEPVDVSPFHEVSRPDWTIEVAGLAAERLERRVTHEVGTLRGEMREGHAALRHEVRDLQSGQMDQMAALRTALRQELACERIELLKWTLAVALAQLLVTGSLIALLLHDR